MEAAIASPQLGLDLHEGLTHDAWRARGEQLARDLRQVQWKLGDWLMICGLYPICHSVR